MAEAARQSGVDPSVVHWSGATRPSRPRGLKKELIRIPTGTPVGVFCLNMKMEDVLVRGRFGAVARYRGVPLGTVDLEWVYNSMPPCHGQIYPEVQLKPVTSLRIRPPISLDGRKMIQEMYEAAVKEFEARDTWGTSGNNQGI